MFSWRLLFSVAIFACSGHACYLSGWSRWVNDYEPSTVPFPEEKNEGISLGGGDMENMNQTERNQFCSLGHGTISNIECATKDGVSSNNTSQTHLECSVDKGFKCSNRLQANASVPCFDYKIHLYCQCYNPLSTTSTVSTAAVIGIKVSSKNINSGPATLPGITRGHNTRPDGHVGGHTTLNGSGSKTGSQGHHSTVSGSISRVDSLASHTTVAGQRTNGSSSGSGTAGSGNNGSGSNGQKGVTNRQGVSTRGTSGDQSKPGNGAMKSGHLGFYGLAMLLLKSILL